MERLRKSVRIVESHSWHVAKLRAEIKRLEEALTNDEGNFYYFRWRPSEVRDMFYILRNGPPATSITSGARATPFDKWLSVLLDKVFKVLSAPDAK